MFLGVGEDERIVGSGGRFREIKVAIEKMLRKANRREKNGM